MSSAINVYFLTKIFTLLFLCNSTPTVVQAAQQSQTKRFPCTYPNCKVTLTQKGDLERHFRTHSGERPFCCFVCKKTFNQKGNLLRHFTTHTGEKKFVCNHPGCRKKFARIDTLKNHQFKVHQSPKGKNTLKNFKCTYPRCTKTLAHQGNLSHHLRAHGEKTIPCTHPGCSRTFKYKGNLTNHLKSHLKKNNDAPTRTKNIVLSKPKTPILPQQDSFNEQHEIQNDDTLDHAHCILSQETKNLIDTIALLCTIHLLHFTQTPAHIAQKLKENYPANYLINFFNLLKTSLKDEATHYSDDNKNNPANIIRTLFKNESLKKTITEVKAAFLSQKQDPPMDFLA